MSGVSNVDLEEVGRSSQCLEITEGDGVVVNVDVLLSYFVIVQRAEGGMKFQTCFEDMRPLVPVDQQNSMMIDLRPICW